MSLMLSGAGRRKTLSTCSRSTRRSASLAPVMPGGRSMSGKVNPFRAEGRERSAEQAGVLAGILVDRVVLDDLRQGDKCRYVAPRRPHMRQQRAHVRMIVRRRANTGRTLGVGIGMRHASEHRVSGRGVRAIAVCHRAHQADLVHVPGQSRKQFGELNARHVAGDRPELAANSLRRCRLWIPRVVLRRPASQEQQEAAPSPAERRSLATHSNGASRMKIRPRQAQAADHTQRQEITPRDAAA